MDREILFRGKRVRDGEWVYGYYANCRLPRGRLYNTGHYIIKYPDSYYEIYTSTLGQYTGLKDRNGKRIFEGDVLFDPHPSIKKHYTVIWEGGTFYRRTSNGHYLSFTVLNSIDFEVIGNIHDNPELLREPQP
jgi:uncharacterized phage protein (TIGR01671 family)